MNDPSSLIALIGFLVSLFTTSAIGEQNICVGTELPESAITPNPRLKDIAAQYKSQCVAGSKLRHFGGITLGFVTPWNGHGYDIAKQMGHKFTHISPVWLQIRHNVDLKYKITGAHDIDTAWVQDVQKTGAKVLPRLLFEGWTSENLLELETVEGRNKAIKLITGFVKKHNFDGIVLEGWAQLLGSGKISCALGFTMDLAKRMGDIKKDIILVVPPSRGSQTIFGSKHFDILAERVTAFSIMTYDYSSVQKTPGPTSPLNWIRDTVEMMDPETDPRRAKLLLGLNFYGYHFITGQGLPEAIVGNQFIDLTSKLKGKMKLDKEAVENYVEIKTKSAKHTVYYPTLYSISKRIQLAEEMGAGISIWELGQGLDYFYELL